MDQSNPSKRHAPIVVLAALVLSAVLIGACFGQRVWSHQTTLTQRFEACMEAAPFKSSLNEASSEAVVSPEDLPRHFEEFDQIFRETGLPPVWDGKKLVPWTIFHQESILVAEQCHRKLDIQQPQKELRGTFAKPVWDPNSKIWQEG